MKKPVWIFLVCLGTVLLPTSSTSSDDPLWFEPGFEETLGASETGPPPYGVGGDSPTTGQAEMGVRPHNDLLSINFLQTDIREVLSAIAMEREINLSIAKDVAGQISIHLYHVTLDDALDAVTVAGGAGYRKQGDVFYVYKPSQTKTSQAEEQEMRVFQIKYADVEKVKDILEAVVGSDKIEIHEPSKTIIAEDTPENIRKIDSIVRHWDAKPRQVMIEAKILEIDLTDEMALGVDWEQLLGDVRIATGGFSKAVIPTTDSVSPVPGIGSGGFGNILVGSGTSYQFTAAIDALEAKTHVHTLSTPKILAIHGKPARVQVGGQQGYRVTTTNLGVATETIEFIDTGTILDITPYINESEDILLEVKPEISTARIEEDGIPVVNSTVVTTWMLAKSGETVFIGGLIQDIRQDRQEAVPYLGRLPVVGNLFGRKEQAEEKSELIVLITPQIVQAELDRVNLENKERVDQKERTLFRKEEKKEEQREETPEAKKEDDPKPAQEEARPKRNSKAATLLPAYMSDEE